MRIQSSQLAYERLIKDGQRDLFCTVNGYYSALCLNLYDANENHASTLSCLVVNHNFTFPHSLTGLCVQHR